MQKQKDQDFRKRLEANKEQPRKYEKKNNNNNNNLKGNPNFLDMTN